MLCKMLQEQLSTNTRPQLRTKPGAAVSCFLCRQMQREKDMEIAVEMVPKKSLAITMYTQNLKILLVLKAKW